MPLLGMNHQEIKTINLKNFHHSSGKTYLFSFFFPIIITLIFFRFMNMRKQGLRKTKKGPVQMRDEELKRKEELFEQIKEQLQPIEQPNEAMEVESGSDREELI